MRGEQTKLIGIITILNEAVNKLAAGGSRIATTPPSARARRNDGEGGGNDAVEGGTTEPVSTAPLPSAASAHPRIIPSQSWYDFPEATTNPSTGKKDVPQALLGETFLRDWFTRCYLITICF